MQATKIHLMCGVFDRHLLSQGHQTLAALRPLKGSTLGSKPILKTLKELFPHHVGNLGTISTIIVQITLKKS